MFDPKNKSTQYRKHTVGKNKQNVQGQFALNDFGRPEAMFVYGSSNGTELEFTVDVDFAEQRRDDPQQGRSGLNQSPQMGVDVVGAQFLCPRCYSALYVKGKSLPDGREIQVHWNKLMRSHNDGLIRPAISIDGVLRCDYYSWEVGDEVGKIGYSKGISSRCGWAGGIINGKMFDHHSANTIVSQDGKPLADTTPKAASTTTTTPTEAKPAVNVSFTK